MSLSIGIVGLPNVGKSTLFNALTKNNVLAANYPFATIEPNTGIVPVPDDRLEKLADLFASPKIVPATVTFVDIAGLVAGAHQGEGLGNAFLAHIRETDAIAHLVRAFDDSNVQHVHDKIHPQKDIEVINTELILKDIQTIDSYLPRLQREVKGNLKLKPQLAGLEIIKTALNQGKTAALSGVDLAPFMQLNLITAKPMIYVFNLNEQDFTDTKKLNELKQIVSPANCVFVSAKIEAELSELDDESANDLMESYGLKESGLERLSRIGYQTLDLQSFLTAGEKEVRAWTIKRGTKAPQAAGVIHGDFERGFIAAEIVSFDDLITAKSWAAARASGKVRTEGKQYIMKPDDVVEFRFNV